MKMGFIKLIEAFKADQIVEPATNYNKMDK